MDSVVNSVAEPMCSLPLVVQLVLHYSSYGKPTNYLPAYLPFGGGGSLGIIFLEDSHQRRNGIGTESKLFRIFRTFVELVMNF